MSNSKLNSISGSDLIIDHAKIEQHQICGSKQCPGCGHKLEGRPDWVGLPAGVKFDPTDQELIEHLEAKVKSKDMKSHPLIDEFIPTIEGEDGICYTHPEKLPGVTRDGLSRHFFHRPSKAYTTGTRKRRKIQTECDLAGGETRWHKTGKTRPVMANGKQKGCKKILVLYTNFGKNRKPEKTNWVMHQYHLGQHEEEKEGELVVSKIFYQTQPRQCNWSDRTVTPAEVPGELRREIAGSRKEVFAQRDEMSPAGIGASISGYSSLDIHQLKFEHFSFAPFRRSFEEVGIEEASTTRKANAAGTCGGGGEFGHHVQQMANHHSLHLGFHVSQPPPHQITSIISPPPPLLHHTSMVLDQDSYHDSPIMIQNEGFQQEEHHKLQGVGERSASGLEELIMGCTSKQAQETQSEWMKYSSFWPDPDNPNLHGHG